MMRHNQYAAQIREYTDETPRDLIQSFEKTKTGEVTLKDDTMVASYAMMLTQKGATEGDLGTSHISPAKPRTENVTGTRFHQGKSITVPR